MADLDPLVPTIAVAAARAGVAADGVAEVEHPVEREVAAGDDAGQVDVDLVAADDHRRASRRPSGRRPAGS